MVKWIIKIYMYMQVISHPLRPFQYHNGLGILYSLLF